MADFIARPSQFNKGQIISESEENNRREIIYTSLASFFQNEKSNITSEEVCVYFQSIMV
jgi:hypothetical protein